MDSLVIFIQKSNLKQALNLTKMIFGQKWGPQNEECLNSNTVKPVLINYSNHSDTRTPVI